jgi:hypothetical protein
MIVVNQKEISMGRKLVGMAKKLKAQRKAVSTAEKEGKDACPLSLEVVKTESWFQENYPELDVASNKAINAVIRDARNAIRVATDGEAEAEKHDKTITVEPEPADYMSAVNTNTIREKKNPVRRAPGGVRKATNW